MVLLAQAVLPLRKAIKRARAQDYTLFDAVGASLNEIMPGRAATVVKHDLVMMRALWLVVRRRRDVPDDGEAIHYSAHVRPIFWVFLVLNPVEIGMVELIVPWPVVRFVLMIAGILGTVWFVALIATLYKYPHSIDPRVLRLRYMSFFDYRIPVANIVSARPVTNARAMKRSNDVVDGTLVMEINKSCNVSVVLREPCQVDLGKRGVREVIQVDFWADDPQAAAKLISARLDGMRSVRQTSGVGEEQKVGAVRRRWVTVALIVPAVPFVLLAGLRLVGADGDRYTIAALALTPYAAVGGLVLGAVTLLLRRWWTGGIVLLLAIALTAVVVPRMFSADQPRATGRQLRVMAANLLAGHADARQVVNLVRENQVDVVNLVELTPTAVDALDKAGLFSLLPNKVLHPARGTSGSGLMSKYPLSELRLTGASTRKQPSARLALGGGGEVDVVAVHPAAPTWDAQVWRAEFSDLPIPDASGPARILAGDFNATLDHATLRGLLDSGYVDAAEHRGDGLVATWPDGAFPPPVAIDHVLVDRRVAVKDFRVFDMPGSDHHAIYAELILPN